MVSVRKSVAPAHFTRCPCPKQDAHGSSEPGGAASSKEPRYPSLWKGCHVKCASHNSEGTLRARWFTACSSQQFPTRCRWDDFRKPHQWGRQNSLPRPGDGCYLGPLVSSGTDKDLCQPWLSESSYFRPHLRSPLQHPPPPPLDPVTKPPTPPTGNVLFLKQNGGFRGVHFIMLYNLCTCYIYSFWRLWYNK